MSAEDSRIPGRRKVRGIQRVATIGTAEHAPSAMRPVKGVGRHQARDYCPECGHTFRRCICTPEAA